MRALLLATTLLAAAAAQARAASVTLDPAPLGYTGTARLPQYGGTAPLTGIGVTLDSALSGTVKVQSLEAAASTAAVGITANTALSVPGSGSILSVANSYAASVALAAYTGGATDYSGASAHTFTVSDARSGAVTLVPGNGPGAISGAPFIGAGTVGLGVANTGSASLSAPLNVAAQYRAAAGATVGLTYSTAATAATPGSSAGSGTQSNGVYTAGPTLGAFANAQTTALQSASLAAAVTGGNRAVAFSKFDPALGTLDAVNVTLGTDFATTFAITGAGGSGGSGSSGRAYALRQGLQLILQTAGGTVLDTVYGAANRTGDTGTANGPDPMLSVIPDLEAQIVSGLDAFEGAGGLTLFADSIGTLAGTLPGDADLLSAGTATARVTLSYTYTPGGAVPEPGAWAIGLTGLAGLLAARRRAP